MDVSQVHDFLDQGGLLRSEWSVITYNGCYLLHGDADGFDEIRLLYLKGTHHGIFDDGCTAQDQKEQRIDCLCFSAEANQQKRQGKKKGIPAVGTE